MYIFIYCDDAISPCCRYRIISNEVTEVLCEVKAEDWTSYFIFTCNIQLFLPYFCTPTPHSDSSSFLFPASLSVCKINSQTFLQTQAHNLIAYLCVHTHSWFCVWLCFSVCVHVCIFVCQLYTGMHVLVRRVSVCELGHVRMDFPNSSLQFLVPMHFCNILLLSHHTFFHAVCPVVSLENIS